MIVLLIYLSIGFFIAITGYKSTLDQIEKTDKQVFDVWNKLENKHPFLMVGLFLGLVSVFWLPTLIEIALKKSNEND